MIEKSLIAKFKSLPVEATPGFVLQVYYRGHKKIDINWGQTWTYYDLASLTKILFTVPWLMKSVDEKKLKITQKVQSVLPWIDGSARVEHLLSHSAGNLWWKPFYQKISLDASIEFRKLQLKEQLQPAQLRPSSHAVYSDIDFFLLGFLLENIWEKSWFDLSHQMRSEFEGFSDLFFNVDAQSSSPRSQFAPTEQCVWRQKLIQAEVHDENAWALGGIAPHAGLFGTCSAVSKWGLQIRRIYRDSRKDWITQRTVQQFVKRRVQDWSLGFMMPTAGASSAGRYFSSESFGHTGFTGTSWWYDPRKDLMVTLLSNRIHPDRNHNEFKNCRPLIHDWVCEVLNLA